MAKYRNKLPQLADRLFLTDGGIETTLIFLDGLELPYFAAFDLLKTDEGRARAHATISRATSRSRSRTAPASSWKARPGAPTRTGATSSAIPPPRSPR